MKVIALLMIVGVAQALDFRTIMTYLEDDPAQFSVLTSLLKQSHLDAVLEAPGGKLKLQSISKRLL